MTTGNSIPKLWQNIFAGILIAAVGSIFTWVMSLNRTIDDLNGKVHELQMQIDDNHSDIIELQQNAEDIKDDLRGRVIRLETKQELKK